MTSLHQRNRLRVATVAVHVAVTALLLTAVPAVAQQAAAQTTPALSVDLAVARALNSSMSLAARRAAVDEAAAGLMSARAALFPSIEANAAVALPRDVQPAVVVPAGALGTIPSTGGGIALPSTDTELIPGDGDLTYRASVAIRQTLFTSGAIRHGITAAQAALAAERAVLDDAERSLREEVVVAWHALRLGRASLAAVTQLSALLDAGAADRARQLAAGTVNREALLVAESQAAGARAEVVATAEAVRSAEISLAWLMGSDPLAGVAPLAPVEPFPSADELPGLGEQVGGAESGLPELRAAEARARAAEAGARVAAARGLFRPQIQFSVEFNLRGDTVPFESDTWVESWADSSLISLGVRIPLFDGLAGLAGRDEADARLEQARSGVAGLRDSLVVRVQRAREAYLTALARREAQAAALALAVERDRNAEVSAANGVITADARRGAAVLRVQASLDYAQQEFAVARAYAALERLTSY